MAYSLPQTEFDKPHWWLQIEHAQEKYFCEIREGQSLGSALSNGLQIRGKGLRPVQGLFQRKDHDWLYRDFRSNKVYSLHKNLEISFPEFRLCFDSLEGFLDQHHDFFCAVLRDSLKKEGMTAFDKAVRQIGEKFFLDGKAPALLKASLEAHYQQICVAGPVEALLSDPEVTDILIESFDRIYVDKEGQLQKSDFRFSNQKAYELYLENLLSTCGKSIDQNRAYLDFMIRADVRAHLIGPPLTDQKFYLSLRKARERIWTLNDLAERGFLRQSQLELVRRLIREKKTILISGATGAGKTSFLNACLDEIPWAERLVVIEDTTELRLERGNCAFLRTRMDEYSQMIPISMGDLVRNALRMRPDRLVIGEVRGAESLDFLNAINTGHTGSFSSLHANSARDALWRLKSLIETNERALSEEATTEMIGRNIDYVFHCERSTKGRRLHEVIRVCGREGMNFRAETLDV